MSDPHEELVKRVADAAWDAAAAWSTQKSGDLRTSYLNIFRIAIAEIARAAQEWPTEEMMLATFRDDLIRQTQGFSVQQIIRADWLAMLNASPLMPKEKP